MRDDQLRFGVGVDEPVQAVGDRRQAATPVDQDRHATLRGDREDGREPLVVEQELLRPGMQLDAAGTAVEAALGLLDRSFREVEPDERDQASVRPLREGERTVVRSAKSRLPVGLVEAEDVAP